MTTNVDILFKELPTVAGPHDRKNVSDISSPASAQGSSETQTSEKVDGNEKSFTEHLHEQPSNTSENNNEVKRNDTDGMSVTTPINDPDQKQDQDQPATKEQIVSTAQALQNDNKPHPAIIPTAVLNGVSQVIVTPAESSENRISLDQIIIGANQPVNETETAASNTQNVATDPDNTNIATAHLKTTPAIPASQEVIENTATRNTASTVATSTGKTEPTLMVEPGNSKEISENAVKPENPQIKPQADTQTAQVSTNSLTSTPETNLEQKELVNTTAELEKIIDSQKLMVENSTANNQATIEVTNSVSQQNVLETKIPTETVTVEATKTIPVAAVPNPTVPNKSSNAPDKSNANSSAATSGTSTDAASKVAGISSGGQVASSNSALASAFKSGIQIDSTNVGQKSEPAPLLIPTLNSQGQITSNGLLVVQDVSIQKSETSFPTALKTDAPAMSRMINEQITVAINRQVVNGQNNFSIRLHPAELGKVDIRLEFATDGKMQASMVVENERTLTLLQRDQSALEKALQDAGINLSNKDLNFSLMKQGKQNAEQEFAEDGSQTDHDNMFDQASINGVMQQVSMGYSDQSLDISV